MNILAFDTATEACTAALWLDGTVIERFERRSQHSEHLLPMIDSLLGEAGLTVRQLDAIAFGRGPGSFTGLRIGAGVAQGLAFAAGLPVVPVSSLAALAQGVEADRVLAAFDARMQQVYWGAFQRDNRGLMESVSAETVAAPADLPVPDHDGWVGAGPGWDAYVHPLMSRFGKRLQRHDREVLPQARHLAVIAVHRFNSGGGQPPDTAIPVYIRDDVAKKSGTLRS